MTTIIEGMTTEEYIIAINSNLVDTIGDYTEITDKMTGVEIEVILNSNFSKSDNLVGIKGNSYVNLVNSNFLGHDISLDTPSNLALNWIEDYLQITFDGSVGNQCEIWERLDNGTYILSHTLDSGIESVDYKTWQNADLDFRIRAKNGNLYSKFIEAVNTVTPLVFKTDQSTLVTTGFVKLIMEDEGSHSININWGDGTDDDFDDVSIDGAITKDYESEGTYFITITGDVDKIKRIWVNSQADYCMDCSKWVLPSYMSSFEFSSMPNVYGNIADTWDLTKSFQLSLFHIDNLNFTGDATQWFRTINPLNYEFRLGGNNFTGDATVVLFAMDNGKTYCELRIYENNFTGDISDWVFPNNIINVEVYNNYLTGDLTDWDIPSTLETINLSAIENEHNDFTGDISGWTLATEIKPTRGFAMLIANQKLFGDLSGWLIPEGMGSGAGSIDLRGNSFTKMPRGNYNGMGVVNYSENNCDSDEIDAFLAFLNAYFVDLVVPLADCVYTLDGEGMGIPSAAGLANRTSILGKYTAAGKTATIVVNS